MIGTLAWFRTYGNAAAVVAVPFAATIATTFFSPTSLRAAWMVCCGSKALSSVEYVTFLPLTPPAAFSCSKNEAAPAFCGIPEAATGPDRGNQAPTLIVFPPPPPPDPLSSPPQAATPSAISATANTDATRIASPPHPLEPGHN